MNLEREFGETVERVVEESLERLLRAGERLGPRLVAWIRGLAGERSASDYFLDCRAFPTLALPWACEATLSGAPDPGFQAELIESSIHGYWFIRLIDDVMDGPGPGDVQLLPALGPLHARFQAIHARHFEPEHPFWSHFHSRWLRAADFALRDAELEVVDDLAFRQIAARKTSAATIPLAAVCHRLGRPDDLADWEDFVEVLGRWHQLYNDLFDWRRDAEAGNATLFLGEHQRRRRSGETLERWVLREGLELGCRLLDGRWTELVEAVPAGAGPALQPWLDRRLADWTSRRRTLEEAAVQARRVFAALARLRADR